MAKPFVFFALVVMAAAVYSAPAEEPQAYDLPDVLPSESEAMIPEPRLPRATCDLLSAFGVADSACAAHCLAKRFRGGWCDKGVCHCRR